MSINDLMGDDVFIESPQGERVGPVKASVQGNKVYISDESLVIEEGGKILRPLPNGKSEAHTILEVNFHKDPFGGELSHYEIRIRKESSLVSTPSNTTINITNSQGIQIGNQNVQNIVGALEMLTKALDSSNASPEEKADAKARLVVSTFKGVLPNMEMPEGSDIDSGALRTPYSEVVRTGVPI